MRNLDTWAFFLMLIGFIIPVLALVVLVPLDAENWPAIVIVGGSIFLLGFAIYGWRVYKKEQQEKIILRITRQDEIGRMYSILPDGSQRRLW